MKEREKEQEHLLIPRLRNSEIKFCPQMKTPQNRDGFWYRINSVYDLQGNQSIPWKRSIPGSLSLEFRQSRSYCTYLKSFNRRIKEKQAGSQTELSFVACMYVQGWCGIEFYVNLGICEYLLQMDARVLWVWELKKERMKWYYLEQVKANETFAGLMILDYSEAWVMSGLLFLLHHTHPCINLLSI